MTEKKIATRIQHKIDTWANWYKAENFYPLKGEIIIYTTDENGNEKIGLKIGNGDGMTNVHNLPFVKLSSGDTVTDDTDIEVIQSDWAQEDTSALDYIKNKPKIPKIQLVTWEGED